MFFFTVTARQGDRKAKQQEAPKCYWIRRSANEI
jgi:hypothetical protein